MKFTIRYFLIIVLSITLGLNGLATEIKRKCPGTLKVEVQPVEIGDFEVFQDFSGQYIPLEAEIESPLNGQITKVISAFNSLVNPGDILLELNNLNKDEVEKWQAEIITWEKTLKTRQSWKERSEQAEAQAQTKIDEAKKQLSDALVLAEKCLIRAPFSGKIVFIQAAGSEINIGNTLAKLLNTKKTTGTVLLSENQAGMFKSGQQLTLQLKNNQQTAQATIQAIDSTRLILDINNQQGYLTEPGTFTFKINTETVNKAIQIPAKFLFSEKTGHFTYIAAGKTAKKALLETAGSKDGKVYVKSGLSSEDKIIISDIECLQNGKKIQIISTENAIPEALQKEETKIAPPVKEIKIKETPKIETAEKETAANITSSQKQPVLEKKETKPSQIIKKASSRKCPGKISVLVHPVSTDNIKEYRSFRADFIPEIIEVKSKVSGVITKLNIRPQDLVSPNFLIAQINDAAEKEIKKWEDELKIWQQTLKTRQNWKERSKKSEEQAENKIKEAMVYLDEVRANQADFLILAPLKGIVQKIHVNVGDEIIKNSIVAEIAIANRFMAEIPISGKDDAKLFLRDKQIPVLVDNSDKNLGHARVREVSNSRVVLYWEDESQTINKPFTLHFKLQKQDYSNAIVIPSSLIQTDSGGDYVYRVRDQKFAAKTYIKNVPLSDKQAMITFGLKNGDELITAEIMNTKPAQTHSNLDCITDQKRIQIMELDSITGNYVKRGKIKAAKKQEMIKEAKKPIEKKETQPDTIKTEIKEPIKPQKTEKKEVQTKPIKKQPSPKVKEKPLKEAKCPGRVMVLTQTIHGQKHIEKKEFQTKFFSESIQLKSRISGKIADIKASPGDFVSKDWLLAEIDPGSQSQIQQLKLEIEKWKKILNQRRNWKQRDENAEKQAEQVLRENQQKLDEAMAAADDYMIKSPINGQIISVHVEKNEDITPDKLLFNLKNPSRLQARLKITKEDRMLFLKTQQIPVESENIESKKHAKVIQVTDSEVLLEIDNSNQAYSDQFNFKFSLVQEEYDSAIVITKNQVMTDGAGDFVYITDGKIAIKTYLKFKTIDNMYCLITFGLKEGDELITSEVVSAKHDVVQSELRCLTGGKKVQLVFKDESGKYKIKKHKLEKAERIPSTEKEPAKIKPKKEKEAAAIETGLDTFKDKLFLEGIYAGGFLSAYSMNDNTSDGVSFSDFYNIKKRWLGFEGGINTKLNIGLWLAFKNYSDTSKTSFYESSTQFKISSLTLGVKYFPKKISVFSPYAGIGLDFYKYQEIVDSNLLENKEGTASGYDINFGTLISVKSFPYIQGKIGFQYNNVKDSSLDPEFDLGGAELVVGILLRL
jgi:multidrug efflux pump subunit AcrA (membrane-fusion protein)/outer membrane protein W